MKIKVSREKRITTTVDVEFPLYSSWIISDTATTFNRVDATGLCIAIKRDTGDYRNRFQRPSFELEYTKIDLDPIHSSYLGESYLGEEHDYYDRSTSEDEFVEILKEMKSAVEETLALIQQEQKL